MLRGSLFKVKRVREIIFKTIFCFGFLFSVLELLIVEWFEAEDWCYILVAVYEEVAGGV
jgi:hypothetical protein